MADPVYVDAPVGNNVFFNKKDIASAIKAHGVSLVHYAAMPCPVGRIDPYDTLRRPHEDHSGCYSGFLYNKVGTVTGLFTHNTNNIQWVEQGIYSGAPVTLTLERAYDEGGEVMVSIFDRFYLNEENIKDIHWELRQWSGGPIDKVRFQIASVIKLVDSRDVCYVQDVDFTVQNGSIHWINSPGLDPDTGKGRVYSISYRYHPYYVITGIPHEIRILTEPDSDSPNGKRVSRSWYEVQVVRETISRTADPDPKSKAPSDRKEFSPRDIDYTAGGR